MPTYREVISSRSGWPLTVEPLPDVREDLGHLDLLGRVVLGPGPARGVGGDGRDDGGRLRVLVLLGLVVGRERAQAVAVRAVQRAAGVLAAEQNGKLLAVQSARGFCR